MVHGRGTNRSTSWTDDLPKCDKTGSAMARNGRYKSDGQVDFEHDFEDRHLCVRYDAGGPRGTFLYGVFDGHDGSARAAEYAQDKFPADLLYERLPKVQTERQLCDALQQSFLAVESGFFASLDGSLARRASIRGQLPPGLNDYQLFEKVPHLVSELQSLNESISGGTTAALALIHNDSLFTANVGDSRTVLATCAQSIVPMIKDPKTGGLTPAQDLVDAHQLSLDHGTSNESELDRLSAIGLDRERIRRHGRVGSHENTRSIGDYSMKGGYKEFEEVQNALSEPLIADPFIQRALPLQDNWLFMYMMSDGVYKAVEESHDLNTQMANLYIAQIISHHLLTSASIQIATEQALNYILTDHLKMFLSGDAEKKTKCRKRDDCTLLVRCFHHALPSQPVYSCVGSSDVPADNKLVLDTTGAAATRSPLQGIASTSSSSVYTPTGSPLPPGPGGFSNSRFAGQLSTSSGERTPFFGQSQHGSAVGSVGTNPFMRSTSSSSSNSAQANPLLRSTSRDSSGSLDLSSSATANQLPSSTTAVSPARSSDTPAMLCSVREVSPPAQSLTAANAGPSGGPPVVTTPEHPQPETDSKQTGLDGAACPKDEVPPHAGFWIPDNFPEEFPPGLTYDPVA